MILTLDSTGSYLIAKPEGTKELTTLMKFPGFLRNGPDFFTPAKKHIVYNLYTRLIRKFKDIKYTPDVKALVEGNIPILKIPEEFKYHTTPKNHQEVALRFIYTYQNAGLLLEPGMGKTKVVLDFIYMMGFKNSIIVCPKPLRFVWVEEAEKHRPELRPYAFETTDFEVEHRRYTEGGFNVIVVNYDKAVALHERLAKLNPEFLGLDEGLIKNPGTERTKALTKLSKTKSLRGRLIMSGTLVNNSPLDTFSPVRFLEPSLVGTSSANFREEYCVFSKKDKERKMVLGYRKVPEIRDILNSVSVVMRKEEWLKLPPKHFHDVRVQMSSEQRRVYYELAHNYITTLENGETLEVDIPLVSLIKLQQISNGFAYIDEGTGSDNLAWEDLFVTTKPLRPKKKKGKTRPTYYFEEQPKITALLRLLEGSLAGRRAVVWYNMSGEKEILTKALSEAGIEFLCISGGDKDISWKIKEFNNNPSVRLLLCQAKSINYGVTIMGSEDKEEEDGEVVPELNSAVFDEIFYSLNFSLEVYLQQQDRIHRIGQEHECHYWRLVTNSPIDLKVVESLDNKLSCNQEVLVDIINTLDENWYK